MQPQDTARNPTTGKAVGRRDRRRNFLGTEGRYPTVAASKRLRCLAVVGRAALLAALGAGSWAGHAQADAGRQFQRFLGIHCGPGIHSCGAWYRPAGPMVGVPGGPVSFQPHESIMVPPPVDVPSAPALPGPHDHDPQARAPRRVGGSARALPWYKQMFQPVWTR